MQTILCSAEYLAKVSNMKKNGMATEVKSLILMDDASAEDMATAKELELKVYSFKEVM